MQKPCSAYSTKIKSHSSRIVLLVQFNYDTRGKHEVYIRKILSTIFQRFNDSWIHLHSAKRSAFPREVCGSNLYLNFCEMMKTWNFMQSAHVSCRIKYKL